MIDMDHQQQHLYHRHLAGQSQPMATEVGQGTVGRQEKPLNVEVSIDTWINFRKDRLLNVHSILFLYMNKAEVNMRVWLSL